MSSEIITLLITSVTAVVSAPLGAWLGAKLQSQKSKAEIDSLRAEVQKKLAGVKDNELENVRKANDILIEGIVISPSMSGTPTWAPTQPMRR